MRKLAGLLAGLAIAALVGGCSADTNLINQATAKAQTDATRAQSSAQSAEQSAQRAQAAAQRAATNAEGAQDSARKADDGVARLEAMFASSVTK